MKTDNSFLEEKVKLRVECLPNKKTIYVLDCYAGEGIIWDNVKYLSGKNIKVTRIEKENGKGRFALRGDNVKYLRNLNLQHYDIIDLDAYGIPSKQLQIIFDKNYKGTVVVTAIQSVMGNLPHDMLIKLGYTKAMIKKIPTLFSRNGLDKVLEYLQLNNINTVNGYFKQRKNYFYFKI